MNEYKYSLSSKTQSKTFTSLNKHNIKKRYNLWQEDLKTGTIQSSHIDSSVDTLEQAIDVAKGYQEFSDRVEKGKYLYHVDVEILIVNSDNESLLDTGDIAYAVTLYPEVNDFCETEMW